jgi:hypothetical protein
MTEFDLAEREQLRQTLLAYMKEHKIGVPRLAQRVKDTVHRNPEIPIKTLQRFMKGEVRTLDMHVGFLAQFTEKVSKVDATPRLGFALSAFYSSTDKSDWSGSFAAVESEPSTPESVPYQSKIEIVLDQGAWHVKEVGDNGGSHDIYDGALTSSASVAVLVMKDRLLGLPRTMTVLKLDRGYEGVATAAYLSRQGVGTVLPWAVRTRSARIALKR